MNRRRFALVALSSCATLAGCDTEQKPSHTTTLLNNESVQHALQGLENALSSLEGEVDDFETQSWKQVVPQVESASGVVRDAFEELKRALGTPEP